MQLFSLGLTLLFHPLPQPADGLFISHLEEVLGTSCDLRVIAPSFSSAKQAEKVLLSEIERLSHILSGYEPESEFNRWMQAGKPVRVSDELWEVLEAFEYWQNRTQGALNPAAQAFSCLWEEAEGTQTLPSAQLLASHINQVLRPHWHKDTHTRLVTRLTNTPLRLHTFVKGYVLDKAASRAMEVAGIRGLVLNVGGDLVVRGNWQEVVSLTDPLNPAENTIPVSQIRVTNKAVATSGHYHRGVQIGQNWYSHIIDPRSGYPASSLLSTTVIHPDAVVAGALATALHLMPLEEGLELAASFTELDYLLLTAEGEQLRSQGFSKLESKPEPTPVLLGLHSFAALQEKPWNPNEELVITFELSRFEGRYHRPFVAVWIEDEHQTPVRQLALWYNKPRWLRDLRAWYEHGQGLDAASLGSATRSPGKYTLAWDGKDDKGEYVKQGKYTICIEAAREHGTHQLIKQEIDFNGKPKQEKLKGDVEIEGATLDYRQKKSKR
jgi:thiamine biosynthesis lipoprotein